MFRNERPTFRIDTFSRNYLVRSFSARTVRSTVSMSSQIAGSPPVAAIFDQRVEDGTFAEDLVESDTGGSWLMCVGDDGGASGSGIPIAEFMAASREAAGHSCSSMSSKVDSEVLVLR